MSPVLEAALRGGAFAAIGLAWAIALIRLLGLRTLSKMTAFDFLSTLASGSLLATAASAETIEAAIQALSAMLALLVLQHLLARARRSRRFRRLIENEPVTLVEDGEIRESALRRTGVTPDDLFAKLRSAGIDRIADVSLVTLEVTGDVVILTQRPADARLLRDIDSTRRE